MTELLYQDQPFLRHFSARVLECAPAAEGTFAAVLDRTAFYPEGGGQPCDRGKLGAAEVLDVHERDGAVIHTLDRPVTPGQTVEGEIDFARRLDAMEQHSGEHILSGTLHRLYGAENVGFHIGQPWVRMDIDRELSAEQLRRAETEANALVRADIPIRVLYPDRAQLAGMTYRSKKEIAGQVRIVEIPGADTCACCGTHLERTGQVGLIRIAGVQKYKGGVRLSVACGGRAVAAVQAAGAQIEHLSVRLSAKPAAVAEAADRMLEENARLKFSRIGLEERLFALLAAAVRPGQDALVWEEHLDPAALSRLVRRLTAQTDGLCAAFSPGENGVFYALGKNGGDLRSLCRRLNEAMEGRGGGKPGLCQGSLAAADEAAVRAFFAREFAREKE